MPALPIKVGALSSKSARVWADFFLAPFLCLLVVLASVVVPVRAYAQVSNVIPINVIRNTGTSVLSSATSGLMVAQSGSVVMGQVTSALGSVAINEVRVVSMSSIASRVVGIATPIGLTMLAADLIQYGIKQCTTATTGWCGPAKYPNAGDVGFNGYGWWCSGGRGASALSACQAQFSSVASSYPYASGPLSCSAVGDGTFNCSTGKTVYDWSGVASPTGTCISGYVLSGRSCVPDPNGTQVGYTYPQLSSQLANVLSGNPNRAKDYWGFMPWTDQMAAIADPSTAAQPAQIVSPANGQVVGPRTTTQTTAGTTSSQTTYTVAPNVDTGTLATNPVTVTTTTTTTNPDGSTSTTTTTTTPTQTTPGGQAASQPAAANPLPASVPTPCGLGTSGSPKCQLDETGTKQQSDVDSAQQAQTSALTRAESGLEAAANSQLSQVDVQHQTNSAHFFTVLNMMPSFGTETCTPPTINDTFNHVNITPAICDWYYAAKDIMSLVIAFGFMLGAVFMVRDTAQQTAAS